MDMIGYAMRRARELRPNAKRIQCEAVTHLARVVELLFVIQQKKKLTRSFSIVIPLSGMEDAPDAGHYCRQIIDASFKAEKL